VICPLKFREQLGKVFILIKGVPSAEGNRCLWLMTESVWTEGIETKLNTDLFIDQDLMEFERFIRDGLMEASCDNQGRFQISQKLREYAGIAPQSDVMLVGMSNRIEIWAKESWDKTTGVLSAQRLVNMAARIGLGRYSPAS
jgi:MraZ protein